MRRKCPGIAVLSLAFVVAVVGDVLAQSSRSERSPPRPLPLDVAIGLHGHNGRSPVNLSPDGSWVSHTVETNGTLPSSDSYAYSSTGVPLADGFARMRATLSATRSDAEILLGAEGATSWAPTWSPDGSRVAFYSDAGGEAGLWIWDRDSRQATRVPNLVVRPFFGFETPRWSSNGRQLLVKALPAGMTLAEANALLPATTAETRPLAPEPDRPSVTVRRAGVQQDSADAEEGPPVRNSALAERLRGFAVDLAVVDVTTREIERIVTGEAIRLYGFSPDGRHVAYSVMTGVDANTGQSLFDLRLHDTETGDSRTLVRSVPQPYGIEWSWSPTGEQLAYYRFGQPPAGRLVVIDLNDGNSRVLDDPAANTPFGQAEVPPLWSDDGAFLYGTGGGDLWEVRASGGSPRRLAAPEGWRLRYAIAPEYGAPVVWPGDRSRIVWATARRSDGSREGLVAVDFSRGEASLILAEDETYSGAFSIAASSATGELVYVSRNQQQPGELHAYDPSTGHSRQVSRINPALDDYRLGEARLLRWRSTHGEDLSGALLLPPGAVPGDRLPLVVWLYGGDSGSTSVNRFGLWGSMASFNMHVLATRGYAVLYPDAPVRTGRVTEDLLATVLPGVSAAVDDGWVDPERMAIMGQSYGALNVLAVIGRTDRFKAAVITAAVRHPDLFADYVQEGNPSYWEQGQGNMGGTIWEYPDRYRENSPLFDFPRISTPLLIGQGERDGNLVAAEAIFTALERLGRPVELRLYRDEGHVIGRAANVRDFWMRRLAFLAEHLGLEVDATGTVRIPKTSTGSTR